MEKQRHPVAHSRITVSLVAQICLSHQVLFNQLLQKVVPLQLSVFTNTSGKYLFGRHQSRVPFLQRLSDSLFSSDSFRRRFGGGALACRSLVRGR